MDKDAFFDQLHTSLASKYNLQSFDVQTIRTYISSKLKMTRKDIALWCMTKLKRPLGPERKSRNERIMAFVTKCTDEQWADITQKTEYDK